MEYLSLNRDILVIGAIVGVNVVLLYLTLRRRPREGFRKAKVHRVLDGDTIIAISRWRKLVIRLGAIDCPEYGQHWGDTAKYGLIKLIGGRTIRIEQHDKDKYGRMVATIYVQSDGEREWVNVNARLVTLGHAWVYRQFYTYLPKHRRDELNKLERWARTKRVGLWRTPNPIPPWDWRRNSSQS